MNNCQTLGLPLCGKCRNPDDFVECWVDFYKRLIHECEHPRPYLKERMVRWISSPHLQNYIPHLRKAIELYYPQYEGLIDKLLVLI
jgi:hypothetical protein